MGQLKGNKKLGNYQTYQENKGFEEEDGNIVPSKDGGNIIIDNVNKDEHKEENIDLSYEVQEERYDTPTTINVSTKDPSSDLGVINQQLMINKTVNDYTDAINDYSEFLQGSPTFVTYYSINKRNTTEDVGLGGVVELVGSESPVSYDKIKNFPLWNFDELNPSYDWDSATGISTEIEATAVIIPGTVKPKFDDVILLSYKSKSLLFRVDSIEVANILDKCYYKINMYLSQYNEDFLNYQVIRTYEFDYNAKCIVNQELSNLMDELQKLIDRLCQQYISHFYVEKFNSFIVDRKYDKYLHKFILLNHVFIKERSFMFDIHVSPTLKFTISDNTKFDNTIFERIMSFRKKEYINKVSEVPILDQSLNNVFSLYKRDKIRELDHSSIFGNIDFISDYNKIMNGDDSNLLVTEWIIQKYLTTKSVDIYDYLEKLDDLVVEYYLTDYEQYPIVIYILKEILKEIDRKRKLTLEEQSKNNSNNSAKK